MGIDDETLNDFYSDHKEDLEQEFIEENIGLFRRYLAERYKEYVYDNIDFDGDA